MLKLDASGLVRRLRGATVRLAAEAERAVQETAAEAREAIAKDYWQDRSGDAARETKILVLGRFARRVRVGVPYAKVLDEGSDPHVIEPRRAKALHFGGRFAARVNHPGTRGFDFVRKESAKAKRRLRARLRRAIARAFAK